MPYATLMNNAAYGTLSGKKKIERAAL